MASQFSINHKHQSLLFLSHGALQPLKLSRDEVVPDRFSRACIKTWLELDLGPRLHLAAWRRCSSESWRLKLTAFALLVPKQRLGCLSYH